MHSLKELRAENAAKRLSSDRTAEDADGTSFPAAVPTATPTTAAPRAGRTLAPIGSTGSLPASDAAAPAEPTTGDDHAQQREDREARRRRRLRRRREREQQENAGGDDNSKVSVDESTKAVSGTSQTSTSRVDEDEEGRSTPTARDKGAPLEGTAARGSEREKSEQVGARPPTSRHPPAAAAPFVAEEKVAGDDKEVDPEKNGNDLGKPLSARGAPPKEKPKKKLTPLEARRARIEQQKREEVERTSGGSFESPRSGGVNLPRETLEAKGDGSRGQAEHANSHIDSDRGDSTRDTGSRNNNRTGQATARGSPQAGGRGSGVEHNLGKEGTPAVQSDNDVGGSGTEHDPLIPVGRTSERTPRNGDGAITRKQPETTQEEKKAEREAVQAAGDADGVGTAAPGDNANDLAEGAAGGDGGRFRGMRSRMKQAGKGLMKKKSPASSVRRGKEGENQASSETTRKKVEQPGTMGRTSSGTTGGTSSGDTLSDTEGEGEEEKAGKAGREANSLIGASGVQNTPENRGDDSDTASETEDRDEFDAERDEGDQERKKKWARSKDKSLTDAPLTGDKEVAERLSLVTSTEFSAVHFIGEISGAEGFGSGISCRFRVEGGRHWTCLAGLEEGQTHVIHMDYGDTFAPWNHPVDLHYTTKSIQGWPRVMLQVWQLDTHGRNVLRGYGFRHLPSTPGFSEVSIPCWRPSGSMQEETAAFFLGVTPRLTAEDAVFNRAWDQRCRLITLPAGTVWLQMHGLFRNLEDQGVDNI
ncbi:unnamed protein product [Ectocarpus sp. CCAP 1310/34]|nr:unnamed protein product [Ectocarpus sp. CCAP 1310/34]